jgi:hypothetical protein
MAVAISIAENNFILFIRANGDKNTSAPELNWLPIIPSTGNHIQPQGKH